MKEKDTHIQSLENLIKEKDTYINNLSDVIKGKDQYIASVVSQLEDIQHLKAELNTIYNSHGWKILNIFYKVRDKVFPPDTVRRGMFKRLFHFLISLPKMLSKKKTDIAGGELLFHVETDLSKPFVIGEGNALYLRGWCYHTTQRIQRLYILIDDTEYRVFNHSFVRDDIFREYSGSHDPNRHSMHSGFWVIIPFSRIDFQKKVNLHIRAKLSGSQACTSSLGILTLYPLVQVKADKLDMTEKLSEGSLVAICMTTYNPPIDHFQRQIDSIRNQIHSNWVCIIFDDCSEPEIFEKIKNEVAGDKRFRVYTNPSNLGFYYNFEKCLSCVPEKASFIALSDQDDSWHEDKLSTLLEAFDEKTTLVFSDMNIVDEKGEIVHPTYWTTRENNFTELDLLMVANTVTGASSMFRRELLEWLLPFPEGVGDSYHDQFIACMALAMGQIRYVDRALYNYYQHERNVLGHYIRSDRGLKRKFLDFAKDLGRWFVARNLIGRMRNWFLHYQAVYYNHYQRRVLMAHVLNLRCRYVRGGKAKAIKRFIAIERFTSRLLPLVVVNGLLRRRKITLGVESLLFKSAIIMKMTNGFYRLKRIPYEG
jgi:glycosyltransferase involved in cell wall biosynthesis